MTSIENAGLWRWFEPAIDMLGDALHDCPAEQGFTCILLYFLV